MKLDNYDRTLLAALQGDGRVPQSELGQRAHLSTAAVNRRLKLLEGAGVIEKFSAQLNPRALGYDLTVIVEVKAENERAHLLDEMQRRFAACPQVQQCYYVTGEISVVLVIVAPNMPTYEVLTRRLFAENDLVVGFRSLIALNRVKAGTAIVIP